MTLRAVHATMEKQIMLTESALSVEKELEKASADQLIYRSRHAREAETEAETESTGRAGGTGGRAEVGGRQRGSPGQGGDRGGSGGHLDRRLSE